jgi:HlyD family secretion protein
MRVRADVDEAEVALVRKGQPANLFLQSDQRAPIAGTIARVSAMGTRSGDVVTYETVMKIDAEHQALRVGMTGTVEIEVRRAENALGLPVQAVVHRQRKDLPDTSAVRNWAARHAHSPGEKARDIGSRYIKVVFVHEGNVARARPVETGLSDERRVEIHSGLRADDRVIVGPFRTLDELKDGQPVKAASAPEEPS